MTSLGAIVLDVVGLVLLLWVLNQARLGRLYVGYAVVFLGAIGGTMVFVSIPVLRGALVGAVARLFPGHEVLVLAGCAFTVVLLYVATQITVLANRLATLVRELALRDARQGAAPDPRPVVPDDHSPEPPMGA